MKAQEFAYWLQGFFEIADPKVLTEKQLEIIKNHLNLVFFHDIDPSYSKDKTVQDDMQKIHDGAVKTVNLPYFGGDSKRVFLKELTDDFKFYANDEDSSKAILRC